MKASTPSASATATGSERRTDLGAPTRRLAIGAAALAAALERLAVEDALSVTGLRPGAVPELVAASETLPYRRARPMIGEGEKAVYQDFDLCADLPKQSVFHALAAELEHLLAAALARTSAPLLTHAPRLNDLIVQRYETGSRGITPHRDHLRYEDLVVIIPLSGGARFFVCADRARDAAREVPAPVGHLVLMRAPGFAGSRARPFHFVTDVTERRISFGLRHDVRAP